MNSKYSSKLLHFRIQMRFKTLTDSVQKYVLFTELSSFCILSTYMLFLSLKANLNEIKSSQYRPCPTQNPLFTSGSQHPPRSRHTVHLGDVVHKHELHELTMTRTLSEASGLFELIDFCLSGRFANTHEYFNFLHVAFLLPVSICFIFWSFPTILNFNINFQVDNDPHYALGQRSISLIYDKPCS